MVDKQSLICDTSQVQIQPDAANSISKWGGISSPLIGIGGDEQTCSQKLIAYHISCGHQSTLD